MIERRVFFPEMTKAPLVFIETTLLDSRDPTRVKVATFYPRELSPTET